MFANKNKFESKEVRKGILLICFGASVSKFLSKLKMEVKLIYNINKILVKIYDKPLLSVLLLNWSNCKNEVFEKYKERLISQFTGGIRNVKNRSEATYDSCVTEKLYEKIHELKLTFGDMSKPRNGGCFAFGSLYQISRYCRHSRAGYNTIREVAWGFTRVGSNPTTIARGII
ncbi:hypothetical protein RF11_14103 [Thelohanellus kitauei]|uniref:Uncharacterized protein n=1 Tax=Thelohanellus kitauei TaxID=669202 RepID=A0A0C2MFQ5_THEKT|nr:hypothetical protein RF11_14103 [Thelohanellus kitauei]